MNQERCKVCCDRYHRYPRSFTKALNETLKNCEEVVAKYEKQAANSMSKEGKEYNCECVADHRRLAEWLTEPKECRKACQNEEQEAFIEYEQLDKRVYLDFIEMRCKYG